MPLHLPPAGVARVTASGTFSGTNFANVFHFYVPAMTFDDPTQQADFLADLEAAMSTSLLYAAQSNALGVNSLKGVFTDGLSASSLERVGGPLIEGTDDGVPIFGGSAACLSWKGSWHYRGGKPRTYFGGLTENWLDGAGQIDGSHSASLTTAGANFITACAAMTGSYGSVVTLGALLGNGDGEAGTFAPFYACLTNSRPCSQRRRNIPH